MARTQRSKRYGNELQKHSYVECSRPSNHLQDEIDMGIEEYYAEKGVSEWGRYQTNEEQEEPENYPI